MSERAGEAELAELRTQVMRFRQQALSVADQLDAARAGLRREREQARAEREQAERELLDAYHAGRLDPTRAAVAERVARGETTMADVVHGRDDHPSAVAFREQSAREIGDAMTQLGEQQAELRETLEAFQRLAELNRREGM